MENRQRVSAMPEGTRHKVKKLSLKNIYSNYNFRVVFILLTVTLTIYLLASAYVKYFEVEEIGHQHEKNSYSVHYLINIFPEVSDQPLVVDEMPIVSDTEKQRAIGFIVRDCEESVCPLYRLITAELPSGEVINFQGKTGSGAVECYLNESLDFQSKDVCLDTNGKGWGVQLIEKSTIK